MTYKEADQEAGALHYERTDGRKVYRTEYNKLKMPNIGNGMLNMCKRRIRNIQFEMAVISNMRSMAVELSNLAVDCSD